MRRFIANLLAAQLMLFVAATVSTASVVPPNPMMTSGTPGQMGMYHGMISINPQNEVMVHLSAGMAPVGNTPVLPLSLTPDTHPDFTDESGTGGPDWTVLNGKAYNAQLGWMPQNAGTWTVPSGQAIWIEPVSVTGPGTLEVYEGGQGESSLLLPMEDHTLNPIFVGGQAWKWFDRDIADAGGPPFVANGSGIMVHNWYATDTPGLYEVTYRVYVGDATTGAVNPAYTPAEVEMSWVPEPTSAMLVSFCTLALLRNRRLCQKSEA